jgi:hypothetical protein
MSHRRLTARLTTTLRTKAAQAVAIPTGTAAPPFDPTRWPASTVDVEDHDDIPHGAGSWPAPRPPRWRWMAPAAAAVVVAALAGALAVARSGDTRDNGVVTAAVPDPPDGWLVPTWAPEGMDLWHLDWTGPADTRDDTTSWSFHQLFGDPDAERAIYVEAYTLESQRLDTGDRVTIRGQDGRAAPSVDTRQTVDTFQWHEQDTAITAYVKGLSRDEALAELEALRWRTDQAGDGFEPPADGSLPLRGEWGTGPEPNHHAEFLYSQGVPTANPANAGPGVRISTSTTGGTLGYIDEWFWRGPDAPGAGEGPIRLYDPEADEFRIFWPDGREVYISTVTPSSSDVGPSRETLERIADSLTVVGETELAMLRDGAAAQVGALPTLASAETGVGSLEVHGDGAFHVACLRVSGGQALRCGQPQVTEPGARGTPVLLDGWAIDGTWYVSVAATGTERRLYGDRGDQPTDDVLPAEVATDGAWQILWTEPPSDVTAVTTNFDEGLGVLGSISRPVPAT